MPMVFEMRESARVEDRIAVISNTPTFLFVSGMGASILAT